MSVDRSEIERYKYYVKVKVDVKFSCLHYSQTSLFQMKTMLRLSL